MISMVEKKSLDLWWKARNYVWISSVSTLTIRFGNGNVTILWSFLHEKTIKCSWFKNSVGNRFETNFE